MFIYSFFYFQYTESLFSTTGRARYQGKTINNMVSPYFSLKNLALVEWISIWNLKFEFIFHYKKKFRALWKHLNKALSNLRDETEPAKSTHGVRW